VKAWYVDHVHETTTAICCHCGVALAWVEEVGWVDNSAGSYDMCDDDPYGSHQPTPSRGSRRGSPTDSAVSSGRVEDADRTFDPARHRTVGEDWE
jgi:hypothetical protein